MHFARQSAERFLMRGIVGGVLGGLAFALAEVALSAALGFGSLDPMRAIGSIILGPEAMSVEYPVGTAVAVGLALHLVLSAVYGAIFAAILWTTGQAGRLSSLAIVMGVLYALALWVVNFLVVAPMLFRQLAGDPTFPLTFTVAHFFYGLVLGGFMLASSPRSAQEARVRQ